MEIPWEFKEDQKNQRLNVKFKELDCYRLSGGVQAINDRGMDTFSVATDLATVLKLS